MAQIQMIKELAKKLNLQNISVGAIELKENAMSNLDYLQSVLQQEINMRGDRAILRKQKQSQMPKCSFDITQTSGVTTWQINELQKLEWLENNSNIFITGKCGIGKTSLSVSLGEEAIRKGYKVYYLTIDKLVEIARDKSTSPKLQGIHRYMNECDLIIIDDVMYMSLTREELQLLYRILTFFNELHSIVIITNRVLSEWVDATEDKHLMQTLVDRLTADTRILSLNKVFKEVIDYPVKRKKL